MSAFLAGVVAAMKAKGAAMAVTGGVVAAILALKKLAPGFVSKQVGSFLDIRLKTDDPVDKELAMAIVKWAEHKIPDRGMGRERYELAAKKLVEYMPFLKGRDSDLADIIEEAVARMDEELKKRSK